jgi:hypothetical protein
MNMYTLVLQLSDWSELYWIVWADWLTNKLTWLYLNWLAVWLTELSTELNWTELDSQLTSSAQNSLYTRRWRNASSFLLFNTLAPKLRDMHQNGARNNEIGKVR